MPDDKREATPEHRLEGVGWICGEIAGLANHVERLGVMLVAQGEGADPRDTDALLGLVKATSAHIGLLADMGAKMANGLEVRSAKPEDWLLPPAFHYCGNPAD